MKRIINKIPLLCLAICLIAPISGVGTAASERESSEDLHITVVLPTAEPETAADLELLTPPEPLPAPKPKPVPTKPALPELYPTEVYEYVEEGHRQVIKVYQLKDEDPQGISRQSFARDGWLYELSDITKQETASIESKEHTELITLSTASRDIEEILSQLEPTLEYRSLDGYYGRLSLDIGSIAATAAGTQTSITTLRIERSYPHLSSNDTSLIPKTVTEQGVVYTLADIDWQAQTTATIDHLQLPGSYTALARYTAVGSHTSITGYTVTAEYRGEIAKIRSGGTIYTAFFWGTEMEAERSDRATGALLPALSGGEGLLSGMPQPLLIGAGFSLIHYLLSKREKRGGWSR